MDDQDNSIYLNDLHTLHADHCTWAQPSASGEPPIPREGHTAACVGNQMVIFGGAPPASSLRTGGYRPGKGAGGGCTGTVIHSLHESTAESAMAPSPTRYVQISCILGIPL